MVEQAIHRFLWAKLGENDLYHPLICHLIDVALVAQGLWDEVLSDSIRDHYCTLLDLPREQSRALLSFWIGLQTSDFLGGLGGGRRPRSGGGTYPTASAGHCALTIGTGLCYNRVATRRGSPLPRSLLRRGSPCIRRRAFVAWGELPSATGLSTWRSWRFA